MKNPYRYIQVAIREGEKLLAFLSIPRKKTLWTIFGNKEKEAPNLANLKKRKE
jgi:hypothetical protein